MYSIYFHFPGFFRFKFGRNSFSTDDISILSTSLEKLVRVGDLLFIYDENLKQRYSFQLIANKANREYKLILELVSGEFNKVVMQDSIHQTLSSFEKILADPENFGFDYES